VARTLVVYMRRGPDDPQLSPWLEGRSHLHPVVHRAQDAIAADPVRHWSPAALGKLVGASPRNLARLFRLHAGMTVTEAVNRARIARAGDLIAQTDLGLEQVAERAGFASARHMRRVWAQFHATAPSSLRAKVPDPKGRDLSRVQDSALMGSAEARHWGSAPIPRQRAEPLETHDGELLDPDDRL
jgi:transcriptional regulator GlxA family with amidase domain